MHNRIKWILILVIISLSKLAWGQIFIPTMFWKTKMTPAGFPFTVPGNYTLSDSAKLAVQTGWLTLIPLDKIDSTQADFDNGLHLGTKWDGSALSLQNPYLTTEPQALDASWTPEWENITAYYRFNNSLLPTFGTAIIPTDTATTNNPSGKFNQARGFNGAAKLSFGTGGFAAMGTADFTISLWVYKSASGAYGMISTRNDGSCNHPWWTLFANGANKTQLELCTPNQNVTGTIPYTLNAWNLVTVTRSGADLTLYMNGVLDVAGTITPTNFSFDNGDGLVFGLAYQNVPSGYFVGSLDDVAFWDVALTASQVKALYTGYESNRVINTPQELSSAWTPKWGNLVGYWKMNGNWNDSSGNGINGTPQGTPVFNINAQLGSFSGDFYFTSSNLDLVKLPSYSTVANKPTSQMTVSAWVYSTANSNAWETILSNWGSATTGAFILGLDLASNLNLQITQTGGTLKTIAEGTVFPLNRWVHVAGVADGSFIRLYRDGEEVGTPVAYDGTLKTSMDCFTLGNKLNDGCATSSTYVYRDKIDDVALWNTALSAEEIKTIYKAQSPFYSGGEFDSSWTPKYSNLIAYYNLNNGFLSAKGNYPMTATTGTPVISTSSKLGNGSVYIDGASMLGNSTLMNAITNQSFSFSFWSKRSVNSAGDYILGGGQTSGANVSLHVGYRTNNHFTFAFYANDVDTINAYPDAGEWVHWVGTYSNGTKIQSIYRNGVLENSRTSTANANFQGTGYFCIGGVNQAIANCTSTGAGLMGNVDEVGIWQTELSAADVQTIYQRQKSQFQGEFVSRVMGTAGTTPTWLSESWNTPLPFYKELPDNLTSETTGNYPSVIANLETGLIRLWHMNETAGTTIANATGVADNLTVTGGTLGEPGAFRNALEVNGTPTYAISGSIGGTSVATLSAWVYLTSYPATPTYANIVGMGNTAAANNYDKDLIIDSTGKLYFYTWSGTAHTTSASVDSIPLNTWTHIAGTVDASNTKAYMNGVEVGTTASGGTSQATNSVLVGGYTTAFNGSANRIVDEVALWTRALSAAEILQLYRRGGIRVKFQVRSCTDIACTGESWKGPDNTSGTYYSELFNYSAQAVTPSGSVQAGLPTMTFANFTSLAARPFYQYRTIFETDESTYVPTVRTATVTTNPATTYASNDQYANSMFAESFSFKHLFSFTTIEDGVCTNTYQISKDGTIFYYFNGATWVVGDTTTTTQRNTAATIASNLPSFNSQIMAGGTGNFYLRAFLGGNGSTACYIDNVAIQYD
jgi:hypothetical protein